MLRAIGLLFAVAACFSFGFAWRDLRSGSLPSAALVSRAIGLAGTGQAPSPERIFRDEYNRILASYEKPLDAQELKYAGIQGMMGSLGDPHTMFLGREDTDTFFSETRANFVGVGARLADDPLGAKATRVFDDGPAYKAGLRVNDIITAVDGKAVMGKGVEKVVDTIRGKEGTIVKLQVLRATQPKPLVLSIRRSKVTIPTVESDYLEQSGVGYINVTSFSEPTAAQFDTELAKLEKHPLKGLVIDVRGNPGGLLQTARELLSRFSDNSVVVKMRYRDGNEEIARTYPGFSKTFNYPLVVLIDENSASAAEIFAGALRDYGLATLVGVTTYGKASVQNVFPLVDGSSVKVTIARYFLPGGSDIGRKVDEDGHLIPGGGLGPDLKVDLDNIVAPVKFGDEREDPQLAKAIEVIRAKRR